MGGGGWSLPPAYRRDLASIGLGGYAWQLWGPHRLKTPAGWAGVPATCGRVRHLRDGAHAGHHDDFLAVRRRYGVPVLLRVEALFGGWHGRRDALCRRRRRRHGLHQRVGTTIIDFTSLFDRLA